MNRRTPTLLTIVTLLISVFMLSACGGNTPDNTPDQNSEQAAEALQSAATKTPLPAPDDPPAEAYPPVESQSAPAAESYPPAEPQAAPLEEAYPAAESAASAGGIRTFVVIPEESRASYQVDEEFFADALDKLGINEGKSDVVGTTENISGQIAIDLGDLAAPLGETTFTADLTTLSTDQRNRDGWIQDNGPQFGRFPQATFTATAFEGLPAVYSEGEEVQFQMSGDLTVRDIAVPVVFDVTAVVSGDTLTGTAETRLLMSGFGFEPPNFARTLTVADEFGIRVNIVAREQ